MSVESYIIVPLSKYNNMEEEMNRVHERPAPSHSPSEMAEPAEPTTADEPEVVESQGEKREREDPAAAEEEPPRKKKKKAPPPTQVSTKLEELQNDPKISKAVKEMIKSKTLIARYFEKLMRAIDMYGGQRQLNISNLPELVLQAVSANARYKLENEAVFYSFIIEHNLAGYCRNTKKLDAFYPHWYRI